MIAAVRVDVLPVPPMIVPSQSTSCMPTDGGPPMMEPGNIWNICTSTNAVTAPSLAKHPTSICAACRIPLRVASLYQTARVLCPPCQARHATVLGKPKRQDRTVPRANPYPVVTPITASTHATAYTYPRLLTPSQPPSLVQCVRTDPGGGVRAHTPLRVCIRFGCGARLPAHARGDMCETCVAAGFVRPLPVAAQSRVPQRATEHTLFRPPEPLDLVRTYLLQNAIHGTSLTTENKTIEDESELDLVYPDDVPFATQSTSTISDSTIEQSKPIRDEDAELELVYPDDAAQTAKISSSKPRTKPLPPPPPPTTLREFFTNGLQTIPTLQNLTSTPDKSPLRQCQMPGCNETLPAHTRMERCVKCSIGDWKQRRLASMDASDRSHRSSTGPLMTDSSIEASTMLDDISDVEDEADPPPSSSPSKSSSSGQASGRGIRTTPGWESDLTELSSDSESESLSDSVPNPRPAGSGNTTGLTIRIPLLVNRLPPNAVFRKCGNKRCNIALSKDHRWKTCDPCRRAHRLYQRIRLESKRRSVLGIEMLEIPDNPCRRWRSLSPEMCETNTTLTPENSRPCSMSHCHNRIPLSEVYWWKTCVGCRAKARRKRDALFETRRSSNEPDVVPHFPPYQNRGALLSSFAAQIKGFVEGRIMYLRAKLHKNAARDQGGSEPQNPKHVPMVFAFVGEYSIVTGQRDEDSDDHEDSKPHDDPAETEAMRQEVLSVVLDLERLLRTKFSPGEAFAIDKGGMIVRFTCSLELIAPLRPLTSKEPQPASNSYANASEEYEVDRDVSCEDLTLNRPSVPLVKTLSGELEAVIVPDDSHRLFHGRRMVIRYSMLG